MLPIYIIEKYPNIQIIQIYILFSQKIENIPTITIESNQIFFLFSKKEENFSIPIEEKNIDFNKIYSNYEKKLIHKNLLNVHNNTIEMKLYLKKNEDNLENENYFYDNKIKNIFCR